MNFRAILLAILRQVVVSYHGGQVVIPAMIVNDEGVANLVTSTPQLSNG